jgi:hypothetical protein
MSAQRPSTSGEPFGTFEQVPSELGRPHDLQVPLQSLSQQYPWAQKPDVHSFSEAQASPFGLRPHEPLMQTAGDEHSASVMHALLQALAPQRNGKQEVALGTTQTPVPSQLEPAVDEVVPAGQEASLHDVPATYFWQAPDSHLPFVPQLICPWSAQRPAGSTALVATLLQTPSEPGSAQLRHAPWQAVWQQMPCSQIPLLH